MRMSNWLPMLGGLIFIIVAVSLGFHSLDTLGLSPQAGVAVLLAKERIPAKKTYRTDYIAGQPRVIPQFVPETFNFKLRLNDIETTSAVDHAVFDSARIGDQIAVSFQQGRFTQNIKVVGVRPPPVPIGSDPSDK